MVPGGTSGAAETEKELSMTLWIIFIGTLALSLFAAARVRAVYARHSRATVRSGVTGGEAAELILRQAGIRDVEIAHREEALGDHYDPLRKRLVLSTQNYFGSSPAALSVAAHECGHAIQHQVAYRPLHWRMAAVGITTYAGQLVMWLPLLGIFTGLIQPMVAATVLAAAWGVIMLFNLVTLPVEFDASRRAKAVLRRLNLIAPGGEAVAVGRVLDAAAWTYVAAFITSLVYFLWHVLPLVTGRQRG
jgi:Zn-dependent membrane protease YugP